MKIPNYATGKNTQFLLENSRKASKTICPVFNQKGKTHKEMFNHINIKSEKIHMHDLQMF